MADFRILLPDRPDVLAGRELDWDNVSGTWTLSEREYGSSTWELGLPATEWDLGRYARTCDFVWHRGRLADRQEDSLLASVIDGSVTL
jgi:hypothetical protein